MRFHVRVVPITLAFSLAAACASGGRKGDDSRTIARRGIEAANERMAAALERGSASDAATVFTDDAVLLAATEVRGRAAIAAYYAGVLTSMHFDDVALTTDDVEVSGDMAYEMGTSTIRYRAGGQNAVTERARYLAVWKRQRDGSWLVHREALSSAHP